jgi:plastocyanin
MHRKITLLAVSAALLGAGVVSGCGGDDEPSPAAASTPAQHESATHEQSKPAEKPKQREAASKPASKPAAAKPVSAAISNFAFAPQAIEVEVGQEITWTNEDSAPHTVTATSGAEFDSGTMEQGATYSWKATKAGTVEYFCAIHPSMTGTITVK